MRFERIGRMGGRKCVCEALSRVLSSSSSNLDEPRRVAERSDRVRIVLQWY